MPSPSSLSWSTRVQLGDVCNAELRPDAGRRLEREEIHRRRSLSFGSQRKGDDSRSLDGILAAPRLNDAHDLEAAADRIPWQDSQRVDQRRPAGRELQSGVE